jgi:ElaB/YqjD/DUF883 family membrane-anchored ribosome-binding protein
MSNSSSNPYGSDAQAEIAALREKVDALMQNRVGPAVSALADEAQATAQAAAQAATDTVRHQVHRLSDTVRNQPLTALGVAALAGFVLAALMRR